MTEELWFASKDVLQLLRWLGRQSSDRKLRLIGCECLRRLGERLPWEASECIKYIEKAEDGLLRRDEAWNRVIGRTTNPILPLPTQLPACLIASDPQVAATNAAYLAGIILTEGFQSLAFQPGNSITTALTHRRIQTETGFFVPILHDIIGNPFRPVRFLPAWRTSAAVQLARGMYDSRDFAAMPILADALQEAGCDNDDVLNHCRDVNGVHVRGCWVVDGVLGKS